MKKSVAVVGSGIAGMAAAYLLGRNYQVTLFEKNDTLGGHTRTLTVPYNGQAVSVDTGFIVFNHVNYPELTAFFEHLNVETQKSDMSFAFSVNNGEFEWGARSLNALFGQRKNLVNPAFYRLLSDMFRFFKKAPLIANGSTLTLGELLQQLEMREEFCHRFIVPMGAAIWSCPADKMLEFPAHTFVRFFKNHGLLSVNGHHQWHTVTGGAQKYIDKITDAHLFTQKLSTPVKKIQRLKLDDGDKVRLSFLDTFQDFDEVVIAAHADEALAMLQDASTEEEKILSAFQYQKNVAYLHRDETQMPRERRCWSSWNYNADHQHHVSLTYWMNLLQDIHEEYPLFVTLNPVTPPASDKTFDKHIFSHPIFTREAVTAQALLPNLQGARNTWYCGAYHRYGFHEDGLLSAVKVATAMGAKIPWH